eukprot:4554458-Pleurochrysis_carterae.AAC.4
MGSYPQRARSVRGGATLSKAAKRAPTCRSSLATSLRAAVVFLLDERHLGDDNLLLLAAYFGKKFSARLDEAGLDVAHADALLEAGAEAAAGGHTHLLASLVKDGSALADGRTGGHDETCALAGGRLVGQLGEDALRADEGARLVAPALGDDPEQRALDRAGRVVKVVAVEAEPSLPKGNNTIKTCWTYRQCAGTPFQKMRSTLRLPWQVSKVTPSG